VHNALSLPAEVTIYTIGELQPLWLNSLREAARPEAGTALADDLFRVEAANVAEVDAAGVQLLMSLSHALARQHRQLQLVQPSAALASACQALGLPTLLANAELAGVTS
jgi:ABC-type transporter Mla MlaB component